MEYIGLYLAGLFVVATGCQWIAWRTHMPAILYLLLVGFLLGPVTGVFDPDAMFGELLFPLASLGVAVILFEGSLTLRFRELKGSGRMIRNLCSVGVLVTWTGMASAAYFFTPLSWPESFLFGALTSVTGPTVIAPMLRSMQPSQRISNVLRWEGIVVDPLGALLALGVLVFIESQSQSGSSAVVEVIKAFAYGGLFGYLGGKFLASVIRYHWVPEYLLNLTTLAVVLGFFSISNQFVHESGLIAVTVMGMYMANQRNIVVEQILHFKEHLSVIIISMLFLILSARVELDALLGIAAGGFIVLLAAQFIVRPLSIWISSIGTNTTREEKWLLSWVAPRGIVAAAISAVFAERLLEHGYESAATIVPLTFMIIIGTVVIQSATAKTLALKLGLSDAESQGVLIVGINRVSMAIARVLIKQGIKVRMADSDWSSVRDARMIDIPVYYGNPLSEGAEFDLDLGGLRNLIALSPNPEYNTLICTHFKPTFEPTHIFTIATGEEDESRMAEKHKYTQIFEGGLTWQKVASYISKGWEIRSTKVSESYTIKDHRKSSDNKAILLGGISPKGKLRFTSSANPLDIEDGWTALFLTPPKDEEAMVQKKFEKREQKQEKKAQAVAKAEGKDSEAAAKANAEADATDKPQINPEQNKSGKAKSDGMAQLEENVTDKVTQAGDESEASDSQANADSQHNPTEKSQNKQDKPAGDDDGSKKA